MVLPAKSEEATNRNALLARAVDWIFGYDFFPNTRTVDAHVVRLRQKLEDDTNTPRHFLTVHGVGYRFVP